MPCDRRGLGSSGLCLKLALMKLLASSLLLQLLHIWLLLLLFCCGCCRVHLSTICCTRRLPPLLSMWLFAVTTQSVLLLTRSLSADSGTCHQFKPSHKLCTNSNNHSDDLHNNRGLLLLFPGPVLLASLADNRLPSGLAASLAFQKFREP